MAFWCSRSSDTQQGNFPQNRHRLNTRPPARWPLGCPGPSRRGGGHDCPAHRSPDSPRARPGAREHGKPGTARRLPVAAAPEVPAIPDDVVYGFGRMDESGRVGDRAMTGVLGWQPGTGLRPARVLCLLVSLLIFALWFTRTSPDLAGGGNGHGNVSVGPESALAGPVGEGDAAARRSSISSAARVGAVTCEVPPHAVAWSRAGGRSWVGDAGGPVAVPRDRDRCGPEHLGAAVAYLPGIPATPGCKRRGRGYIGLVTTLRSRT